MRHDGPWLSQVSDSHRLRGGGRAVEGQSVCASTKHDARRRYVSPPSSPRGRLGAKVSWVRAGGHGMVRAVLSGTPTSKPDVQKQLYQSESLQLEYGPWAWGCSCSLLDLGGAGMGRWKTMETAVRLVDHQPSGVMQHAAAQRRARQEMRTHVGSTPCRRRISSQRQACPGCLSCPVNACPFIRGAVVPSPACPVRFRFACYLATLRFGTHIHPSIIPHSPKTSP